MTAAKIKNKKQAASLKTHSFYKLSVLFPKWHASFFLESVAN